MACSKYILGLRLPAVRFCARNVFPSRSFTFAEPTQCQTRRIFHNDNPVLENRSFKEYGLRQSISTIEPSLVQRNSSRHYSGQFSACKQIDTNQQNIAQINKRCKSDTTKNSGKEEEKKLTVFQRFKVAYKEHGKILIGVHLVTSSVWFGTFFYAASVGVDVIPLMEKLGFSDRIINPFRSSSLGNVALAYLMYKLATPARYTVTLGGTNLVIKYLRSSGKMAPQKETLKGLAKDSRTAVSARVKKHQGKMKEQTGTLRRKVNLVSARMKKQQGKVKQKGRTLRSRVNLRFNDMRKKGRSRLKVTTSKLMSRVRRKRAGSRKS